jgi:hypothetical protein
MPGSRSSTTDAENKSPRESGEDSEDESEILEESPCGRWLKRKEEVSSNFKKYFFAFTILTKITYTIRGQRRIHCSFSIVCGKCHAYKKHLNYETLV